MKRAGCIYALARARDPLAGGRKEARERRDREMRAAGEAVVIGRGGKGTAKYANVRRAADGGIICTPARAR